MTVEDPRSEEAVPEVLPSALRCREAKTSPLRILLSEGSSTSAREVITILGMQGHHVEVCDPDPRCLGRFSLFVRRFHRCPGLGVDPIGYVTFVLELIGRRRFDVLLPIHEQGYVLSKTREAIESHVAVALPSHAAYQKAHSKASFSCLLSELGLPQPRTRLVGTREDVLALDRFPLMLKAATGTASRAVWLAKKPHELAAAVKDLARGGAFADVVDLLRSRVALEAEVLVLRQQINVLRRTRPRRPAFIAIDRLILEVSADCFPRCMMHGRSSDRTP
jgi:hypothetical protein